MASLPGAFKYIHLFVTYFTKIGERSVNREALARMLEKQSLDGQRGSASQRPLR